MNNKHKVLSLIERTNNLNKSASKTGTANTTASSINHPDSSPAKRIKKPPSLSLSENVPKSPMSRGQTSSKNPFQQVANTEGLNKSSLDFIKNLNFALMDLIENSDKKAKKYREYSSTEQKTLTYIKHLVKEQRKVLHPDQSNEKVQGLDLAEQNLKVFTQEAAEEICLLEKKCKELEEENEKLKVALEELERKTATESRSNEVKVKSEKTLKSIHEVLETLKSDHESKDKSISSMLKKKVHDSYQLGIDSIVNDWVTNTHLALDHTSYGKLTAYIVKSMQKGQEKQKSLSETLAHKSLKREKLEHDLKSHH